MPVPRLCPDGIPEQGIVSVDLAGPGRSDKFPADGAPALTTLIPVPISYIWGPGDPCGDIMGMHNADVSRKQFSVPDDVAVQISELNPLV